ncbi:HAD family hydrolase [Halobacteriales archaeon QS_1_68_17]|nr:MAG: HAD family hydrolase [Halobacteriales archaeon QS_1_68_17]
MTYRGAVVDLDGTVYRGDSPIPGAVEGIETLRAAGIDPVYVSNNPAESPEAYAATLGEMGVPVEASRILSAGVITTKFLVENHRTDDLFVIGSGGLRTQLRRAGLGVTADPASCDVLVASWDPEFGYGDMVDALRADDGTSFYGTDPDRTVPREDGLMPGSGAIINAVAGVLEREPDRILGKPSGTAVEAVLEVLGVDPGECLVVGDRLDTDLAMGERAGMTTVLVLTGVTDRARLERADFSPDYVLDSLADIGDVLDR